jgi:hypothetical protein
MRSSTWIAQPIGLDLAQGKNKQPYTEIEKAQFRDDPEVFLSYRKKLEQHFASGFRVMIKNSNENQMAQEYMTGLMKARLKNDPRLCKLIIPEWPVGCRRLTPGEGESRPIVRLIIKGFLEALIQPNVEVVDSEITAFRNPHRRRHRT